MWVGGRGVGRLTPPNNTSPQGLGTNVDHFCPKVVDHCLHPEATRKCTSNRPPVSGPFHDFFYFFILFFISILDFIVFVFFLM